MELVISAEQMAHIVEHCQGTYPYEGCGMLLGHAEDGRHTVVDVLPTGNDREPEAQSRRYSIPPEDLLAGELQAEARGLEVIGYFHSHPDHPDQPSEYDREHAWPLYSYLIVAVHGGQAVASRSWRLRQDGSRFDQEPIRPLPAGPKFEMAKEQIS